MKYIDQVKKFVRTSVMPLVLLSTAFILSSCGSGVCLTNTDSNAVTNLQIDYIGTIPVLNGVATSSYFYIHNDGNVAVNGISYTLANSESSGVLSDITDGNGFTLKGSSLANCASIAAHSTCKIEFTTPHLNLGSGNNSLFKLFVTSTDGKIHEFDQVINYNYYNVALNNGVNFATSNDVVANVTDKRYMIGYVVAGGANQQSYSNINLIISDPKSLQLNQGFSNGESMVSGQLIPVEFNVAVVTSGLSSMNIVPQYVVDPLLGLRKSLLTDKRLFATQISAGQGMYVSTSNQSQSALALKPGIIPILTAPSTQATAPTIYISNFGESISGLTVQLSNNNIQIYNNSCVNTIESHGSCSFQLAVSATGSGSSQLVFQSNGQTVLTKTIYYAPAKDPANPLATIISNTPLSLLGLQPNQSSSFINLVFSNIGNGALDNPIITAKNQAGKTTLLKIIKNGCDPVQFESQTECIVQVQLFASTIAESGNVYVELTGKSGATQITVDSAVINYYINTNNNIIVSSPVGAESTLNILGNNQDSAQTIFTLTNPSSSTTSIQSLKLVGVDVPEWLIITNNTCGSSLVGNASCQITIKYGPTQVESNVIGVANLQISYDESSIFILGRINYTATALDSRLLITNVTTTGFTGNGTNAQPYTGSGCNNDPLTMTITYKNISTNYVAQNMSLDIIDGHISPYMIVESNQTTCGYGANPKNLGIGDSCNLVLVAPRNTMIDNSNFNLNVNYPSASWNTSAGFITQTNFMYNGSSTLYANYTQPVITSTMTPTTGVSLNRVLTQTVSGVDSNCGNLTTTISAIPYVINANITSGSCTVNEDLSITCINNSSQTSNVISYTLDNAIPVPADLFAEFSLQNLGMQVWYNPDILFFHVGNLGN